jgi:hypothetical protein
MLASVCLLCTLAQPSAWATEGAPWPAALAHAIGELDELLIGELQPIPVGDYLVLWGASHQPAQPSILPYVVRATYDRKTGTWTEVHSDPFPEGNLCAPQIPVTAGNRLLVAYGEREGGTCFRRLMAFDPQTATWADLGGVSSRLAPGGMGVLSIAAADTHMAYFWPQPEPSMTAPRNPAPRLWAFDLTRRAWVDVPQPQTAAVVDLALVDGTLFLFHDSNAEGKVDEFKPEVWTLPAGASAWQHTLVPGLQVQQRPHLWVDPARRVLVCCGGVRSRSWNLWRNISPHESPWNFAPTDAGQLLDPSSHRWSTLPGDAKGPRNTRSRLLASRDRAVLVFQSGEIEVLAPGSRWRKLDVPLTSDELGHFPEVRPRATLVIVGTELWRMDLATGQLSRTGI